jgi:molecular chaperone GrpE
MVTALLPLLDSFDAAIAARQVAAAGTPQEETIHGAYGALHSQLLKVLQDNGVVTISEVGVPFDPNLHEAVMRVPATDGQGDGEVVRCFRQGYQVGDQLVRPALVVVATTD